MLRSDEFGAATRELRESWPVALVRSGTDTMVVAAQRSRLIAMARSVLRDFLSLSARARVQLVALAIAVGAAAHVLMVAFVPPHFAPAVPRSVWIVAGIASAAGAAAARRSAR